MLLFKGVSAGSLTGRIACCHHCALVAQWANGHHRDVIECSWLEVPQNKAVVFCWLGMVQIEDCEVVHVLGYRPTHSDRISSLGPHLQWTWRVWNCPKWENKKKINVSSHCFEKCLEGQSPWAEPHSWVSIEHKSTFNKWCRANMKGECNRPLK